MRLFFRIYAFGVALLLAVVVTVAVTAAMTRGRPPWHHQPARLAQHLADQVETADPAALQARLDSLAWLLYANLAVYTADGRSMGRGGPEPPPALSASEHAELTPGDPLHLRRPWRLALPVGEDGVYVVVSWQGQRSHEKFVLGLLGILAVLALLSWPAARAVVRPLEAVADTARRLGEGDLAARTGLGRKDEIGALARAVDEMAERIERLVAHEKELVANVSHELRTPLARIRVALELAAEEAPEGLAGVEDDLRELETLVEDVITTARLDLGTNGYALRRHALDVGGLAEAAAARFREAHQGVPLEVSVGELPDLDGDRALLARVLHNLLENAVRHGAPPLALTIEAGEGEAVFRVLDRGPGPGEGAARLFDPFVRGDASRTRATGGVGLGLTLCKRIVEAHGGRIEAGDRDSGGAEFRFTLPS